MDLHHVQLAIGVPDTRAAVRLARDLRQHARLAQVPVPQPVHVGGEAEPVEPYGLTAHGLGVREEDGAGPVGIGSDLVLVQRVGDELVRCLPPVGVGVPGSGGG